MKAFAALYAALDASTSTLDKVAALRSYFNQADAADAAWAVYCLAGGKARRSVGPAVLRAAACREAGISDWLFDASYQGVTTKIGFEADGELKNPAMTLYMYKDGKKVPLN